MPHNAPTFQSLSLDPLDHLTVKNRPMCQNPESKMSNLRNSNCQVFQSEKLVERARCFESTDEGDVGDGAAGDGFVDGGGGSMGGLRRRSI